MQIIDLTLNHWNFHCPVTGEKITGDGETLHFPPSLKGVWVGEALEAPELKDPELEAAWKLFYDNLTEDYDLDEPAINQFLDNYTPANWLAFKIYSGSSFFNDTAWFIIDMNTGKS